MEGKSKVDNTIKALNESVVNKNKTIRLLENKNAKLLAENSKLCNKTIELFAEAYGISAETLKLKVANNTSIQFIESVAKSIRDDMDAQVIATPDILSLGKKVPINLVESMDPEIDRAVRISSLLQKS
jgi:hypothetical protein